MLGWINNFSGKLYLITYYRCPCNRQWAPSKVNFDVIPANATLGETTWTFLSSPRATGKPRLKHWPFERRSSVVLGDRSRSWLPHTNHALLARIAVDEIKMSSSPDRVSPRSARRDGKRRLEDGDKSTNMRAKRRGYTMVACNECKRRKIKCNGLKPCQRCHNLSLDCVFDRSCCSIKDSE